MRKMKGFTLIELLIGVAVITILAGIALPAYSDYIKRVRIREAFSKLLEYNMGNPDFTVGERLELPLINQAQ